MVKRPVNKNIFVSHTLEEHILKDEESGRLIRMTIKLFIFMFI